MAETVSVRIKIDDDGSFKRVEVDAADLKEVVGKVTEEVHKLNNEVVNCSQAAQAASAFREAVSGLNDMLSELVSGYNDDAVALAKLTNNMRNSMVATDGQIARIEELCDAQERLGVIEKDAQMAGAQELATYLGLSSSLEALIPAMNDMAAQQIGIGASGESVAQIASMLGKVMNGQVEALSRYGYKFDEAQKHILRYGDESERVAVLAEVVSGAVGGMNETLRQTDAGAMFGAKVAMDGMKDSIGGVVSGMMPLISGMAQFSMAAVGVIQLGTALKSLATYLNLAAVKSANATLYLRMQTAAQRMLAAAGIQAAAGTTALSVAVAALYGALTMGIGALIAGIASAFSSLAASGEDAADGVNVLKDAEDAYKQTSSDMRAELAMQIVKIEELIKAKGDEQSKVAELNDRYSDVFGTYRTLEEWYDILANKSAAYCRQLGYQAQMETIAKQIAAKEIEKKQAERKMDELIESYNAVKTTTTSNYDGVLEIHVKTKEYKEAKDKVASLDADIAQLRESWNLATEGMKKAQEELDAGLGGTAGNISWQEQNLTELTRSIERQKKTVSDLAGVNDAEAKSEMAVLAAMQQRQKFLQRRYGLDTESGGSGSDKGRYNGENEVEDPDTYNELSNNIKYYTSMLENVNVKDTEAVRLLSEKIARLKSQQQLFNDSAAAASRPEELKTLRDIDAEIEYQTALRKRASEDEIAGIDDTIRGLQRKKEYFGYTAPGVDRVDEIDSYDELDRALGYYTGQMQTASAEERAKIQAVIDALNSKKEAMEDAARMPGPVDALDTYREIEDAVSYYSRKLKTASAEERAEIQEMIDALNGKKEAMGRIASIPAMRKETARLDGLGRQELAIELELIGLEGIKAKIRSLQKMLKDTSNPLGDKDRKPVEEMIGSYKRYENILRKSSLTMNSGWGAVKGVGNSVKSLTQSLKGNGSAWDKISGSIDGVIGLYQSFGQVIGIIKTVTSLTRQSTAAKVADTAAETTRTATEAAGAGASAAASATKAAAAQTETTANVAAAASGVMAAHSSIPFVGIALGLAAVAAIIAVMASLPKFAAGGIAYGPTLGLFGEYAGAASNPEVVAPLDRLKALMGDTGTGGEVVFRIEGRSLVGILDKENRRKGRIR